MEFSIYNLYNRANPYFIYFDVEGEGSLNEGDFHTSISNIFVPHFTVYNMEF